MRNLIKMVASGHARCFTRPPDDGVSFLMYHRVVGDLPLELDLPFDTFRRQMAWLNEKRAVISYPQALESLISGSTTRELKYAITFDDAYEDFYTLALPVLREYHLPATLFVPTRFIEEPGHLPLSRRILGSEGKIRPMTWEQLREVAAEPLITIGAHTHNHPELVNLSDQEIADEMTTAAERFQRELGFVPQHFAYPRGIWNDRVRRIVSEYCDSAVTTSGEIATPRNVSRYALPRVPIRRSDGWYWFEHRIQGRLLGEERLVRMVKKILGHGRGYERQ